jgi:hypothetical protein
MVISTKAAVAAGVLALMITGAACGTATAKPATTTTTAVASFKWSAADARFCHMNTTWSNGLFSITSFNQVWLDEVPQTTELVDDAVAAGDWTRTEMRNLMLAYSVKGNFNLTMKDSIIVSQSCIDFAKKAGVRSF